MRPFGAQEFYLVPQEGGALELEPVGGFQHFVAEFRDDFFELALRLFGDVDFRLGALYKRGLYRFRHAVRRYFVELVELPLDLPTPPLPETTPISLPTRLY